MARAFEENRDRPNVPQFFDEWKLVNVRSAPSFSKNSSPLLSIFSVRDDYRMNDPARKAVLLAPTGRRRTMKYICLGYPEPGKFEGRTEEGRHATLQEGVEYNG